MTERCWKCDNCLAVARVKDTCLRALTRQGMGEDVRIVWNSALQDFPCQNPPMSRPGQETVQSPGQTATPPLE